MTAPTKASLQRELRAMTKRAEEAERKLAPFLQWSCKQCGCSFGQRACGGDTDDDIASPAHRDRATLLAIVQRQVGEIAALKHEHFAATIAIEQTLHETEQRSDAARAEVERLKADLQQTKDELSAAAHSARSYAEQMDMAIADKDATREASDRWQRKLHAEYGVTEKMRAQVSALAQENARLINEVGLLDATAREQRQRAEVLARGIAAYRSGSFTLAQVWENEEGTALAQLPTKNPDPTNPQPINLIYRRFKAALDLRGLGVEEVARQAGVSSRHVWFALRNQRRPSAAVLATIRAALGEPFWLFATGQTDTLTDAAPTVEAQPCR